MDDNTSYNEVLESQDERTGPVKLPAFLNVLTILTFIGSGLSLVSGLYNITTIDQQAEQIAEMNRQIARTGSNNEFLSGMIDSMSAMLENVYPLSITGIIVAICCLIGAYWMRQLNKNGFYLYTGASIVGIAVPIAIVGFGLVGGIILVGSIFTIAFIIMYGVNLKYLK